jgi:hypothetical protein
MTELEKNILEHILENVDNYEGTYVSDLHNELFNTDYWVIGYYNAEKEILKHCSAFRAIEIIKQYEELHFGECNTSLSNEEAVCNMLTYILGEQALNRLDIVNNCWDKKVDESFIALIKEEIQNLL